MQTERLLSIVKNINTNISQSLFHKLLEGISNHSAFNLSNALGAYGGALAISTGAGWASTGIVGACLGFIGLILFLISIKVGSD